MLFLEHELVPARRENARHGRLADLAAESVAMLCKEFAEAAPPFDTYDVVQLLARIREVLAEVVVDREALLLHLGLHHLGDERHATAAGCAGAGRAFERADVRGARADSRAQLALRH